MVFSNTYVILFCYSFTSKGYYTKSEQNTYSEQIHKKDSSEFVEEMAWMILFQSLEDVIYLNSTCWLMSTFSSDSHGSKISARRSFYIVTAYKLTIGKKCFLSCNSRQLSAHSVPASSSGLSLLDWGHVLSFSLVSFI